MEPMVKVLVVIAILGVVAIVFAFDRMQKEKRARKKGSVLTRYMEAAKELHPPMVADEEWQASLAKPPAEVKEEPPAQNSSSIPTAPSDYEERMRKLTEDRKKGEKRLINFIREHKLMHESMIERLESISMDTLLGLIGDLKDKDTQGEHYLPIGNKFHDASLGQRCAFEQYILIRRFCRPVDENRPIGFGSIWALDQNEILNQTHTKLINHDKYISCQRTPGYGGVRVVGLDWLEEAVMSGIHTRFTVAAILTYFMGRYTLPEDEGTRTDIACFWRFYSRSEDAVRKMTAQEQIWPDNKTPHAQFLKDKDYLSKLADEFAVEDYKVIDRIVDRGFFPYDSNAEVPVNTHRYRKHRQLKSQKRLQYSCAAKSK